MEDQIFATRVRGFTANLSEEGGKTVVVILTPSLKGMMMALRALHSDTEK
jgi:hypothetical protein